MMIVHDARVAVGAMAFVSAAGESPSPIGEWMQLINLPLSVLILYGFARGWFITGKEHQRVVEERDQERIERKAAQAALTDKVLPLVTENERTMGDLVRAIERQETRRRS